MALPQEKQQYKDGPLTQKVLGRTNGRFTQSEGARRSRRTVEQQGPFNVQVTRNREHTPVNTRYQTIDERRKAESTKETTSERLRTPVEPSEQNNLKNRLQKNLTNWNQQQRVQHFRKNKNWLTTLAKEQGGIKGVAKKAKVIRATWVIASMCFTLFIYQLVFWLISLLGAALVASEEFAEILDLNWRQKIGLWFSGKSIETVAGMGGEQLFLFGYIVFIVIAVVQLATASVIYSMHKVNPFLGKGLTSFGLALVLAFIPFIQIVPLIFWWMYVVFKEHK